MFEFNLKKAFEAIVYFSEKEKQTNGRDIDFIKINKYCYFSEKYHLKNYLRPIFGDTYIAMPEGAVPSEIYDIVKLLRGQRNAFMEKTYRDIIASGISIPIKYYAPFFIVPLRKHNEKTFSKSEIEAMDFAFNKYHAFESKELSLLSHQEDAWDFAQKNSENEMDFGRIIGDREAWEYIECKSLETKEFRASFQFQQ